MKLQDARAVVTGGASGLGHAVARHLIASGARVSILDVQQAQGEAAASALGDAAGFVRCDVTSEAEVTAAMERSRERLGGLNLLVNCAGVIGAARVLGRSGPMSGEFFTKVVHINLIGTFLCDKAAAALMQHNPPGEDGERGVLIHTSSVAAFGIRCVAIAPGIFRTPMAEALPAEAQESLARQIPFPARLGKPEEFAQLVATVFELPMLNGTTIRLDGAVRMQPR